jgi:ABC-type Fe3+-hydroxamate transport system substrate-binding protein
LIDQLGRHIDTTAAFKRIVCLVPSQTELLCHLGLQDSLVGITKFCVHPNNLNKTVTLVGGTKNVHWETLKSLKADIVLCNKEENSLEIVQELETFTQVHVADIYTLEDCYQLMEDYGTLFKVTDQSHNIIEQIQRQAKNYANFMIGRPRPKVAYLIWKKPWMLAAGDTFVNHLLEVAGYDNAFKHLLRYPQVELSDLKNAAIDILFLSSEPYPFSEKHKKELETLLPGIQIVLVDGEFFSWYGSRLRLAFNYFRALSLSL